MSKDKKITEDDIRMASIYISKNHIDKTAFYNLIRALDITDSLTYKKILNFVAVTPKNELEALADEIAKLKTP